MSDLIVSENKLPAEKSLVQLTTEIKFYVNQWGQNTIEIGKRLIQAKELVPHGEWANWLEKNFSLKKSTAYNFMQIAERFGNFQTSGNLNQSQMVEMLALPAEETEKFIDEKAVEGRAVEDMTVQELRAEVRIYKMKLADKDTALSSNKTLHEKETDELKSEIADLKEDNTRLEKIRKSLCDKDNATREVISKLTVEKNELEQRLKNEKTVAVLPDDYEQLKQAKEELGNKISALEKRLKEKPTEVQIFPADYESSKAELAELREKYDDATKRAEIFQKIDTVCALWKDVFQSKIGSAVFAEYEKSKPNRYNEFVGSMTDFLRNNNLL